MIPHHITVKADPKRHLARCKNLFNKDIIINIYIYTIYASKTFHSLSSVCYFIFLLQALKGIPRQAYYIATKIGRYEMDYENMFDFTVEKTRKSIKKSLDLLGLDYVDIIQVRYRALFQ